MRNVEHKVWMARSHLERATWNPLQRREIEVANNLEDINTRGIPPAKLLMMGGRQ